MSNLPEPVVTEEFYTVDQSCRGDNTFYVSCDVVEHSQNYAVCLHVLGKLKRGESFTKDSFTDCRKAIACGKCPAIAMRQAEMEANRALYFRPKTNKAPVERPPIKPERTPAWQQRQSQSDSYRRGYEMPARTKPTYTPPERRPAPPPRRPERSSGTDFNAAELVNMVKKEETKTVSAADDKEFLKRRPGESLVAYATRLQERNKK